MSSSASLGGRHGAEFNLTIYTYELILIRLVAGTERGMALSKVGEDADGSICGVLD